MLNELLRYNYWEHKEELFSKTIFAEISRHSKPFNEDKTRLCYQLRDAGADNYKLAASYFIGVDWLVEKKSCIIVAPKLNSKITAVKQESEADNNIEIEEEYKGHVTEGSEFAIDYFAMLNKCLAVDFLYAEIDKLVDIDWKATEIPIKQEEDLLSPLIIVKFLNTLVSIVRKGLKKSYYKKQQHINSRVKGKILVAQNIQQNVLKNRLTNTLCQFEEFGVDSLENRLLKKAFAFAAAYIDNHSKVFNGAFSYATHCINYCRPAFDLIGDDVNINEVKTYQPNPFFKEYSEGLHLAKMILKRYAYSVSNITAEKITTPPYWIDMPKLFELYTYYFLKQLFPEHNQVTYHFRTYGNELDFLVNAGNNKMVVDAKYKSVYLYGKNHNDIRQVSGYARLQKVYDGLGITDSSLIDCLIVYPDVEHGCEDGKNLKEDLLKKKQLIRQYKNVYKVGIKLPVK